MFGCGHVLRRLPVSSRHYPMVVRKGKVSHGKSDCAYRPEQNWVTSSKFLYSRITSYVFFAVLHARSNAAIANPAVSMGCTDAYSTEASEARYESHPIELERNIRNPS